MEDVKKKIEDSLLQGEKKLISDAVFKLDMLILRKKKLNEQDVIWIIKTIDSVMGKDALGSNELVNLFQSYWSKMNGKSQNQVKSMCKRHISNLKNLGTQTAMEEILQGEYLS